MSQIHYEVVQHADGWAYRLGETFSQTYPTHGAALQAAREAAERQEEPGEAEPILYEDASGTWHEEFAAGSDRPDVEVDDEAVPKGKDGPG